MSMDPPTDENPSANRGLKVDLSNVGLVEIIVAVLFGVIAFASTFIIMNASAIRDLDAKVAALQRRQDNAEGQIKVAVREGRSFSLEAYKEHLRIVEGEITWSNGSLFRRSGKTPRCIEMFPSAADIVETNGLKSCKEAVEDYVRQEYRPNVVSADNKATSDAAGSDQ